MASQKIHGTLQVQPLSVELGSMAANSIDSDQYVNASIDTAHIANSQITNALMADDSVDSAELAAGSVDLAHMSADSVDSNQYVDGSIDLVHMSADSVDSDQYVNASIDTAHIANSQITNALMADDSVDSAELVAGSIDTAHIANSQITNALMADDAIDSAELAAGSVDLAHMSADSVDSNQYVDGSIDLVHMSAESVDSDQYVDGSIDTAHIADNQVTLAKMDGLAATKFILGSAGGNPAAVSMSGDGSLSNAGALTVTGSAGDFTVTGDLTVSGSVVTVDVANMQVEDSLIQLGKSNPADALDLGFAGTYTSNGTKYAGLFRDASDGIFYLFNGSEENLSATNVVNRGATGFVRAELNCLASSTIQLETARTIGMTGDVVWSSGNFNGSGNVTAGATIQANAVTTAKILDSNVTADKLASNAVTTAKIMNMNVTGGKFHANVYGKGIQSDGGNLKLDIRRLDLPSDPGNANVAEDTLQDSDDNAVNTKSFLFPAGSDLSASAGLLSVYLNGILQRGGDPVSTVQDAGNDKLKDGLIDYLIDTATRKLYFLRIDVPGNGHDFSAFYTA